MSPTCMAEPEHAELGASGCKRWWNCPGCIALIRQVVAERDARNVVAAFLGEEGDEGDTEYSREGTAAHEVGRLCLLSGQDPEEFNGREVEGVLVTAEMTDAVREYTTACRTIIGHGEHRVETRFSLASLDPPAPMYGTADFMAWMGAWLWINDYKHGAGVRVEAKGNEQLKYYALGALLAMPPEDAAKVRYIKAGIIQPRGPGGNPARYVDFDPTELAEWSIELMERAKAALEPDAALVPGDWCQFCPARGRCPALAASTLEVVQADFAVLDAPAEGWTGGKCKSCSGHGEGADARACQSCAGTGEEYGLLPLPTFPELRLLTPEQLARILQLADPVRKFLDAAEKAATAELSAGREVPGWKLVPTRGREAWRNGDEVETDLELFHGLTDEERFKPREPISPAQARELIATKIKTAGEMQTRKEAVLEARARLADLIHKPSGGVTLAPTADTRPGIAAPGSEFDILPADTTVKASETA